MLNQIKIFNFLLFKQKYTKFILLRVTFFADGVFFLHISVLNMFFYFVKLTTPLYFIYLNL